MKNQNFYLLTIKSIRGVVKKFPLLNTYISDKVRFICSDAKEYKTVDFFLNAVERLVQSVYDGIIGGEFIDIMSSLIQGQINQAYEQAWMDDGGELPMPLYLQQAAETDILRQYDFVDQYYRDIVDARVDKTPVSPLLSRAVLWANRWNESYNNAILLIQAQEGGNMIWVFGDTDHCATCESLNGVVASANEWVESGYQPQGSMLDCGGFRCKCSLEPTSQRRSKNRKAKLGIT